MRLYLSDFEKSPVKCFDGNFVNVPLNISNSYTLLRLRNGTVEDLTKSVNLPINLQESHHEFDENDFESIITRVRITCGYENESLTLVCTGAKIFTRILEYSTEK